MARKSIRDFLPGFREGYGIYSNVTLTDRGANLNVAVAITEMDRYVVPKTLVANHEGAVARLGEITFDIGNLGTAQTSPALTGDVALSGTATSVGSVVTFTAAPALPFAVGQTVRNSTTGFQITGVQSTTVVTVDGTPSWTTQGSIVQGVAQFVFSLVRNGITASPLAQFIVPVILGASNIVQYVNSGILNGTTGNTPYAYSDIDLRDSTSKGINLFPGDILRMDLTLPATGFNLPTLGAGTYLVAPSGLKAHLAVQTFGVQA